MQIVQSACDEVKIDGKKIFLHFFAVLTMAIHLAYLLLYINSTLFRITKAKKYKMNGKAYSEVHFLRSFLMTWIFKTQFQIWFTGELHQQMGFYAKRIVLLKQFYRIKDFSVNIKQGEKNSHRFMSNTFWITPFKKNQLTWAPAKTSRGAEEPKQYRAL